MLLRYCTSCCTSAHRWCYATLRLLALLHIHDATLLYVFLHCLTYMMLRYFTFSCTSSHTWSYATVRPVALPHIDDATLLSVLLHFRTYIMLRYFTSSCTASHTWCYATVRLLALPHIHDATLLYVFLHFRTYMMLRYFTSSWLSSHTWCYPTVRLLALPHIYDATLLYLFLNFLTYMMLRYCTSACTSSHSRGWVMFYFPFCGFCFIITLSLQVAPVVWHCLLFFVCLILYDMSLRCQVRCSACWAGSWVLSAVVGWCWHLNFTYIYMCVCFYKSILYKFMHRFTNICKDRCENIEMLC